MSFILDTDVLSALRRPDRNPQAFAWIRPIDPAALYLSVITLGEIRRGVEARRSVDPTSAGALELWLHQTEVEFADHILAVDRSVSDVWGRITTAERHHVADALIAATAIVNKLTVVTRNVRHFRKHPVRLLNPFEASP